MEKAMQQAGATVWNEIAETQALRTTWAQQMFPLQADDLDEALALEQERLTEEAGDPLIAAAYLRVMPLIWEAPAIKAFLAETGPNPALPQIETAQEAAQLASLDYPMTTKQIMKLHSMLQIEPT
jgi:hypothetical protein